MPDSQVEARPALAHRVDGASKLYRLTSIEAPAVITGRMATTVRCDSCHQVVGCTIESAASRHRRLHRWQVILYGTLALVMLAAIAVPLVSEPRDGLRILGVGVLAFVACGAVEAVLGTMLEVLDEGDHERVRLPGKRPPHSLRHARNMIQDDQGNWRRGGGGGGVNSGFRDCNAEPMIDWSL